MNKMLKGDEFANRYRIHGTLKTLSPLHIGTGEESDARTPKSEPKKNGKKVPDPPAVALVIKDHRGKPIIPGSTLRGVIRHWLLDLLKGFGPKWAFDRNYTDNALLELTQDEQIAKARNEFSALERLFGTPLNAGKVDVWDATCITSDLPSTDNLLHWESKSLTYVDTSVAIDPNTGTAMDKLLYNTEIVPSGVEFELNVVGQNLADEELALILMALQGFNSKILPLQIGARTGRGYGRMEFRPISIDYLPRSGLNDWVTHRLDGFTTDSNGNIDQTETSAGFYALPTLDAAAQAKRINEVKVSLRDALNGGG